MNHIHTTATHGLWVLSVYLVFKGLGSIWVGNHPDNGFSRALALYL